MTTIGYGDYFPKTLAGRIVAFFLCIWGIIMVSLMVVTLTNYVEYDNKQKQSDFMMKKLNLKEKLRKNASSLIGVAWRCYFNYSGKKSFFKNLRFWANVRKYKLASARLKQTKKELRGHIIDCDLFDRFIVENDLISNDFSDINAKSDGILQGAQKLSAQMKSLMKLRRGQNRMSLEGGANAAETKKNQRRVSELSLDKMECIFGSQVSSERSSPKSAAVPERGSNAVSELLPAAAIDSKAKLDRRRR